MDRSEYIWQRVSKYMEQELSSLSYEMWIKPLRPVQRENNKLIVLAPNTQIVDTVKTRYAHFLQQAIDRVCDQNNELRCEAQFVLQADWKAPQVAAMRRSGGLNSNYTFDSFVVGKSNEFAFAAAKGVAAAPGVKHNPLFIYGGTGLGKTHLMHAIGNEILRQDPEKNILYVTSEQFTNELISSLQNKRNEQFRDRYRNVDALLIDDIQFIANKESSVEEFFHTFNVLYSDSKQIVLTSDKQPRDIPSLEERMRTRFEWGLLADISRPDYETRVAILRNKANKEKLYIEEDGVLEYIASHVENNVRELEGSLNRVMTFSSLTGQPVTITLAEEALKGLVETKTRLITPRSIMTQVCNYFDLQMDELCSRRRNRDVARPRQIAMYLIRNKTDLPYKKIGDLFGVKDHTTVIHACQKIEEEIMISESMENTLRDLSAMISGN